MKRMILAVALCAMLLVASGTALAKGGGLTQAKIEAHGWACVPPIPGVPGPAGIVTHCVHPNTDLGALIAGQLPSVPSLNFVDGKFIGTEILIRADLGDESRPCRQGTEADGTYEASAELDFDRDGDVDYYSCHHNNVLP